MMKGVCFSGSILSIKYQARNALLTQAVEQPVLKALLELESGTPEVRVALLIQLEGRSRCLFQVKPL